MDGKITDVEKAGSEAANAQIQTQKEPGFFDCLREYKAEKELVKEACRKIDANVDANKYLADFEKTTLKQMEKDLVMGTNYRDLCKLIEGDKKHMGAGTAVLATFVEDLNKQGFEAKLIDEDDGLRLITINDVSRHFALLSDDKKTNDPHVLAFTFPIKTEETLPSGEKVCVEREKTEKVEEALKGIGRDFAIRLVSDQ